MRCLKGKNPPNLQTNSLSLTVQNSHSFHISENNLTSSHWNMLSICSVIKVWNMAVSLQDEWRTPASPEEIEHWHHNDFRSLLVQSQWSLSALSSNRTAASFLAAFRGMLMKCLTSQHRGLDLSKVEERTIRSNACCTHFHTCSLTKISYIWSLSTWSPKLLSRITQDTIHKCTQLQSDTCWFAKWSPCEIDIHTR